MIWGKILYINQQNQVQSKKGDIFIETSKIRYLPSVSLYQLCLCSPSEFLALTSTHF